MGRARGSAEAFPGHRMGAWWGLTPCRQIPRLHYSPCRSFFLVPPAPCAPLSVVPACIPPRPPSSLLARSTGSAVCLPPSLAVGCILAVSVFPGTGCTASLRTCALFCSLSIGCSSPTRPAPGRASAFAWFGLSALSVHGGLRGAARPAYFFSVLLPFPPRDWELFVLLRAPVQRCRVRVVMLLSRSSLPQVCRRCPLLHRCCCPFLR